MSQRETGNKPKNSATVAGQAKTKAGAKNSPQGSDTKVRFARGLCFKKLFFIFLIGSVFGTFYEQILYFLQTYYGTGVGVWSLRQGVIYGPFNVIYGFGAALMCYLLLRKDYEWWQIFLYAAVLGGIVEYSLSFLQEFFTHTTSWDYSQYPLNINGRTTIPFMIFWGFLGLALVKVVYPLLSSLIESIPVRVGEISFLVLLVFMVFNMLISWTAIIRQTLRHNDVPPFTPVGRFYDAYYTDEYLEKYFPNMVHADKE